MSSTIQPNERPWKPVLQGDLLAESQRTLAEIAARLEQVVDDRRGRDDAALTRSLDGYAGMALFFACKARSELARARDQHLARECLKRACAGAYDLPPTLFNGFVGVAWVACALADLAGDEGMALIAHVDDMLEHLLAWQADEGVTWEYDLLYGLVGLGVYAVERERQNGRNTRLAGQREGRARSEAILDLLERCAQPSLGGLAWARPAPSSDSGQSRPTSGRRSDLGVAHGCAGALGFALQVASVHGSSARAARVAQGAMNFLLAISRQDAQEPFPPVVSIETGQPLLAPPGTAGPMSWCNGPPGIAPVVRRAAWYLGDTSQQTWADELVRRIAERACALPGRHIESGLCHGALGLAHVFARTFHATADIVCNEAAAHCTHLALRRYQSAGGDSHGPDQAEWANPGFRLGTSGMGLALLGLTTHTAPWWDRLLLVSQHSPISH